MDQAVELISTAAAAAAAAPVSRFAFMQLAIARSDSMANRCCNNI